MRKGEIEVAKAKAFCYSTLVGKPWLRRIEVLHISAGSSICFLPHRGNRYTIFIRLLGLLRLTYAFCYHFQLDNPCLQFEEETNSFHFIFF
ncbi:unnamed protein product [Arabidopsis thaliana]|uniref:Uncharacterized protein n=2 Tax=Arabidopsis thaliana TaxID=3702 RepID=A0A654GF33_ARATH|nr:NADH-plastoquinone oxidoreductase subunit [Arabidopsis thaliana]ANM63002.1 NADH-plastoquinone oxidoreductase subunit [Arabidopsis thaliana]CAA0413841.1 unnamed protein product [Arabidopsis thaliana]VYS71752.1 unnamed protein product [Arabidopsis thaliana]|eukprot:NP_001325119.1 NADH-plastoquinone oxidoreductase subunit [Arabidopsis thaliana]